MSFGAVMADAGLKFLLLAVVDSRAGSFQDKHNLTAGLVFMQTHRSSRYQFYLHDARMFIRIHFGQEFFFSTVKTFNGSFLEISSGNYVGSFNYNDTADKVSVNYNNLTKSVQDKCEEILESTITAVKAQIGE